MKFELHHGDCLDVLKALADCSVDAIVTDPPYGLGKEPDPVKVMAAWVSQGYFEVEGSGFMGKKWDAFVPQPIIWKEVFRVLKPGGHLLAFAGTRTQDWMAMSLRFAGFEIRDMIAWCYGSGFPKSLDVSKSIDKAAGAKREVVKWVSTPYKIDSGAAEAEYCQLKGTKTIDENGYRTTPITAPATEAAKQWEGWGTALKPALEPITLARKPPIGTIAANVLEHGTGGLNIDGCRIEAPGGLTSGGAQTRMPQPEDWGTTSKIIRSEPNALGRFPANFIHDNSEQVLALFPETTSGSWKGQTPDVSESMFSPGNGGGFKAKPINWEGDSGSAARFFYCAKASRDDRDEGLPMDQHSSHPTVKPTDLMRYLCRLITPPNGIILDPFTGSGSTGKAAMAEGFRFIGIEREAEYIEIARARISAEAEKPRQLSLF
jgi:site-specific DNA-methyltransferase (adenine-specific)